jgi:putative component of membrane protein insertase Oxa1/YidC/SpoIIIJ protein YidD
MFIGLRSPSLKVFMFKAISLALIGLYQSHLSPRKGYGCAYRLRAGGTGCSGFGKHAIEKHGFVMGLALLRRRLAKCAWHAHQNLALATRVEAARPTWKGRPALRGQAGFVDCACDAPSCDVPSCNLPSCEIPSCGDPFGCSEAPSKGLSRACVVDTCSNGCCGGGDCGPGYAREERRLQAQQARRDAGKPQDDSAVDADDDE